ncbi:hypothetical protein J6590_088949 [Homalodisca vitripennis]|nr:hypothetical protein J6590_088949 [Homalodisca vitripennis]
MLKKCFINLKNNDVFFNYQSILQRTTSLIKIRNTSDKYRVRRRTRAICQSAQHITVKGTLYNIADQKLADESILLSEALIKLTIFRRGTAQRGVAPSLYQYFINHNNKQRRGLQKIQVDEEETWNDRLKWRRLCTTTRENGNV